MAFKDILREKRKELCFTRREMAKKLGVCPSNVQFWEEGSIPKTKENIDAIKKLLGDDIVEIIKKEAAEQKERLRLLKSKKHYTQKPKNINEVDLTKLAKKNKCKNGVCLLNCEGKYCTSPIRIYNPNKFTCTGQKKIVKETKKIKDYKNSLTNNPGCKTVIEA